MVGGHAEDLAEFGGRSTAGVGVEKAHAVELVAPPRRRQWRGPDDQDHDRSRLGGYLEASDGPIAGCNAVPLSGRGAVGSSITMPSGFQQPPSGFSSPPIEGNSTTRTRSPLVAAPAAVGARRRGCRRPWRQGSPTASGASGLRLGRRFGPELGPAAGSSCCAAGCSGR
jgi:hypothetical protein